MVFLEEKYICDGFDHCDNHDDTDEDEGDIDDSEDSSFFLVLGVLATVHDSPGGKQFFGDESDDNGIDSDDNDNHVGDDEDDDDEDDEDADDDADDERIVDLARVVVILGFLLLVDCVKRIVT